MQGESAGQGECAWGRVIVRYGGSWAKGKPPWRPGAWVAESTPSNPCYDHDPRRRPFGPAGPWRTRDGILLVGCEFARFRIRCIRCARLRWNDRSALGV